MSNDDPRKYFLFTIYTHNKFSDITRFLGSYLKYELKGNKYIYIKTWGIIYLKRYMGVGVWSQVCYAVHRIIMTPRNPKLLDVVLQEITMLIHQHQITKIIRKSIHVRKRC